MKLLIDSLQLGLLYGILALGIYISFRILSIPDLTTEGSFAFGLSVSAAITAAGHPVLAILAAMAAGALAGSVTGLMQTRFRIHPILSGIITMSGLYSINLAVLGGSPNLSLVRVPTLFKLIPFLKKGKMGAGLAMKAGPLLETNIFYVTRENYGKARQLMEELFAPKDGAEGEEADVPEEETEEG